MVPAREPNRLDKRTRGTEKQDRDRRRMTVTASQRSTVTSKSHEATVALSRLCCVESDLAARDRVRVGFGSDDASEFGERVRDAPMDARVDSEFVMPSTHVLHERMAADDHAYSVVAFDAAHRAESRFQSTVWVPKTRPAQ